ncbi:hypothetical protein KSP40_PGU012313 [Platanthera guangdongensis]|uniref:IST1-like protein n=1 Tax=Platanthera guangdongensis TaxID=2320717 RepID=A0ABR2LUT5_9ASPA
MLGILISGKFSNKCKQSVKCIRCRLETIRKKKQAMVRYLKKDVADLISGGHDVNAFGRMDALIVEINKLSCYDMIEQYCCCILEHLPAMQKERACPEGTTEAIATLIFAAARFSDLPELADLRWQFTARYGTNMEAYINQEFVEKMQEKSFSKDKKLQLMQQIAQEFSIHWDVKAFEYKLSNPTAPRYDQPKIDFSNNESIKLSFNGRMEITDAASGIVHRGNTVYRQSDVLRQRLNSEKLVNSEAFEEDQKILRTERYAHSRSDVQKKADLDEFKNMSLPVNVKTEERLERVYEVQAAAFTASGKDKTVNFNPPYTKFSVDLNGATSNGRVNPERNRPFNLKPPYVKPNLTKSSSETGFLEPTNYEMSNGGAGAAHLKNFEQVINSAALPPEPTRLEKMHIRSVTTQRGEDVVRTPSRPPDRDDLAARFAALKKL